MRMIYIAIIFDSKNLLRARYLNIRRLFIVHEESQKSLDVD